MRKIDKLKNITKLNERLEKKYINLNESNQDYKDEANVLVTKIGNERSDIDSNKLYEFIINNREIILSLGSELSKIENNLPSSEFIKVLMSYPIEVIKLSKT
jgi:hypothetical protein